MQYPKFLKANSTIGITAPSQGVGDDIPSYEKSIQTLTNYGYRIKETKSVRKKGMVSTSGEKRAKELDELITDKDTDMIMCAAGGDFLIEMLPYINWQHIKDNPKWIEGYSDPTYLLYVITTKLDIATIYGCNAGSFDQTNPHQCLKNNLEILSGNIVEQHSFDYYQKEWTNTEDGYHLTEKVYWETINKEVDITGRIIGGCLDCLKDLPGTAYDYTKEFIEKYKDDGIIWYFDICELSAEETFRILFRLKEAGWFKYIKGIIVGRVAFPKHFYPEFTYQEALKRLFKDLPIIFNADIGHVPPKMTIINGSIAHITCQNGKGTIRQVNNI